ncbi:MAG: CvpA family protein [Anaerolineae bacterium]|nr:CvpA family protein [Anaerolineae bacterium]
MTFGALDPLLILIVLAIGAWGALEGLVRSLLRLLVFYLATIAAGLLYRPAARFFGTASALAELALFWVLFLGVTIAMEIMLREGFPDTRLLGLRFGDHLMGLLPGILCGLILASLVLASLNHASHQPWGAAQTAEGLRTVVASACHRATLRPFLTSFLSRYLALHIIWLPSPPPILQVDG